MNCHSSLLPKHRGPNPFQAAILAAETETGVTYHVVDEGIAVGPHGIAGQHLEDEVELARRGAAGEATQRDLHFRPAGDRLR